MEREEFNKFIDNFEDSEEKKEAEEFKEDKIKSDTDDEFTKRLLEINPTNKQYLEDLKGGLKELYIDVIKILKKYLDLKEENYKLIAIWIIGTYFHHNFYTFPYLFLNAMKGSGKSRTIKLITTLSKNGEMINDIREAVLFRTAKGRTIGIDEFESINSKEKSTLRELLNSAYKKGAKVKRAFKFKTAAREGQAIEEFELYCPIVMANIWGMNEVLGDRCIQIIIERSDKKEITRKMEIFDLDDDITDFKEKMGGVSGEGYIKNYNIRLLKEWNSYLDTTLHTFTTTNTTNTTCYTPFFKEIEKTSLDGRYLELFFPLYIISDLLDNLKEIIAISEIIVKDKKEEDVSESNDVSLLSFLSTYPETSNYILLKDLVNEFKGSNDEDSWINSRWMIRALKRQELIIDKRRVKGLREVVINFKKAQKKIMMFKILEPSDLTKMKEQEKQKVFVEDPKERECVTCGIKTSFLDKEGLCELCNTQ